MKHGFIIFAFALTGCMVGDVEDLRQADYGYVDGDTTTDTATEPTGEGGAAPTTTDTATEPTGEGGSTPVDCVRHLTIEGTSHSSGTTATAGDQGVEALFIVLTASECGDIWIDNVDLQLMTPDAAPESKVPFCAVSCSQQEDWNFQNLKLTDVNTGATIGGPTMFKSVAANQPARVDFNDTFMVAAGTTRELVFTFDVADPLVTPIVGLRYKAWVFGVDSNPNSGQLYFDSQDYAFYVTID